MIFNEWLSLSEDDRARERQNWHVFEPGYWHAMAAEAAARFAAEYAANRHVQRICKSLYRAEELVIAVQTDGASADDLNFPSVFGGFRVLVFPGVTPEGVLVDVSPPAGGARL